MCARSIQGKTNELVQTLNPASVGRFQRNMISPVWLMQLLDRRRTDRYTRAERATAPATPLLALGPRFLPDFAARQRSGGRQRKEQAMKATRTVGILVLVLLSITLVPVAPAAARQPTGGTIAGFDQAPRIAIVSAYSPEVVSLKAQMNVEKTLVLNGRSVYVGTLAGHKVLLTLSGISMVNAAMTTQALIDHFRVERILFSGIAGGVNPSLSVGDVVVPSKWSEYQENLFARETSPGVFTPPAWFQPTLPNYGMMFPEPVDITTASGPVDQETSFVWFQADPVMLQVAAQAARAVTLDRCTASGTCLSEQPTVKIGGSGVSGPTFVDNASYRSYAWSTWSADALDMESAAVAHVATVNGVPFLIFRSLSDLAGGGPGENELGVFFQLAADNSARLLVAFLQAWPRK
jgi:adenosylhomocysteine nucleosidase